MNIAQYILHYCQKRHPRDNKAFPDYGRCRRILLLFESDLTEENRSVRQIVSRLQAAGKEVTAWGYADKKNITTPPSETFRILGRKDTTLFGCPRKERIRLLQSQRYDLLIDLSHSETLPTAWLALQAEAAFKTGKAGGKEPYRYDLMIQADDKADPQFVCQQILFYLQSIQTQD